MRARADPSARPPLITGARYKRATPQGAMLRGATGDSCPTSPQTTTNINFRNYVGARRRPGLADRPGSLDATRKRRRGAAAPSAKNTRGPTLPGFAVPRGFSIAAFASRLSAALKKSNVHPHHGVDQPQRRFRDAYLLHFAEDIFCLGSEADGVVDFVDRIIGSPKPESP